MANMVTFLYCIPNYRFTTIWSNVYIYKDLHIDKKRADPVPEAPTRVGSGLMMKQFKNNTNSYSQHCLSTIGGATARPPLAAGRAPCQSLKGKFLYTHVELCNFVAKYSCLMRIVRAPKSF
jgi:hypothetical protein